MAWFIGQSVFIILAAFLLGILVGWLVWGLLWGRKRLDESETLAAQRDRHLAEVSEKDKELAQLRERVLVLEKLRTDGPVAPAPLVETSVAPPPLAAPSAQLTPLAPATTLAAAAVEPIVVPTPAPEPEAPRVNSHPVSAPDELVIPEPEIVAVGLTEPVPFVEHEEPAAVAAEPLAVAELEPVAFPEPLEAEVEPVASELEADAGSFEEFEAEFAEPAAAVADPVEQAPVEEADDSANTVVLVVQRQGDEDDLPTDELERIEGIGPQMAGALRAAGIRTYEQLAAADNDTLREAIEARGLRFAPSLVTWAQQSQLLADGDEEGFADLTRRLVAGRDEGRE